MPRNPNAKKCKAHSKQTGQQCGNYVKPGWEVCRFHGAGGGAPPEKLKGNTNAVKTGEHQKIWFDTLTAEEQTLIESVPLDPVILIDQQLQLLTIRERRMMQLRAKVLTGWEAQDMSVTFESRKKEGKGSRNLDGSQVYHMVETMNQTATRPQLERVLAIEEALTRVQKEKAKLIDLKHKLTAHGDKNKNGQGMLDELAQVIAESARMLGEQK